MTAVTPEDFMPRGIILAKLEKLSRVASLMRDATNGAKLTALHKKLRIAEVRQRIDDSGTSPEPNVMFHMACGLELARTEFDVRRNLAKAECKQRCPSYAHEVREILRQCEELTTAQLKRTDASRENQQQSSRCSQCPGELRQDNAAGGLVCNECSATAVAHTDYTEMAAGKPTAARCDTDHMRSSLDFLRKLQGHSVPEISPENLARIQGIADRDCITGRNVSRLWFRGALHELGLTSLNEAIPALMRLIFHIVIPQLSENEEQCVAAGMVRDNAVYLQLRAKEGGRCNALAYPYNGYRQIDQMFPPSSKKRMLLSLINLQEAQTLQRHEDCEWLICRHDRRRFYAIGPPPRLPFETAPM
jgi:hypothetical protein